MGELCFSCFIEKNSSGMCPGCGYDPAQDKGKYSAAIKQGGILKERYIVGRVLGQGGFGVTYSALDFATKERVAIKEFMPTALVNREASGYVRPYSGEMEEHFTQGKAGFLEEANTLEQFKDNPHIVNILDYFEENGTAYFVMDYVQGQNLKAYVKIMGGKLGEEAANRILMPIMEAMEDVHSKGIVHRDIAPDNIIVTAEGSAKLIDFGAARYSTGEKSQSLDVILKHGYAPKEQYSRHGRQGPYTDVYAMAATYYYAVTGRVPPDSIDRVSSDELAAPSSIGAKLSAHTEKALMKALSIQPEDRYPNMGDFLKALKGEAVSEKPKPEDKKGRGRVFAAMAATLALAAVAAVFIFSPGSDGGRVSSAVPLPTEEPGGAIISEPVIEGADNTQEADNRSRPELIFEPTQLYNAGGITVTATEYIVDAGIYDTGIYANSAAKLVMSVRNDSGQKLRLMGDYFVVNDCLSLCNCSLYSELSDGEQEVTAYINCQEVKEAGISDISTLEIRLSFYDPSTYESVMSEPVVMNIFDTDIQRGNLDDRGVLLYDDRGIKLVYKGFSDGNPIFYVENTTEYNVELLHKDASVDGEIITEEDVLYMFGICRTGTRMCSDMHLTMGGERLSVSEDSRVVLSLVLYLYSTDGEYIDRIELKDVEIP